MIVQRQGLTIDSTELPLLMLKQHLMANYLNAVWKSLILRDDPYVNATFDAIHAALPGESPQCLIHKLFACGCHLLKESPAAKPSNDQSEAALDALRTALLAEYTARVELLIAGLFPEDHQCSGPSYEQVTKMNPDEPFFIISD
jgi:hypothetical protein